MARDLRCVEKHRRREAGPRRSGGWRLATALLALGALASEPARAACGGDCNGDAAVSVAELIIGVRIALGEADVGACAPVDASGDGAVSVAELIAAVRAALGGCAPAARLIALSREGRIASLDLAAPWTVRASADLGADIASARCRAGRCLVVHPAVDMISVVDAADLSAAEPITLPRGAEPRDVALVDEHTAVVGQYGRAQLLEVDLTTRLTAAIDLSPLADADGLPEVLRLASCGRRVFAQLRRVDHDTGVPSPDGAVLAVVDLDRPRDQRVVDADPDTPGIQGIALAARPAFDMPVDCAAGRLFVAEPEPLMQGGGGYEEVDLAALVARDLPIDTGAEVGGFESVGGGEFWLITHTEFGPGPSSHLTLVGGPAFETHNTFAMEHVNDLALDRDADRLFYPDACFTGPANPSCDRGVYVFQAHSGERLTAKGVDPGFAPIEVVVSR
ncbi:MAG: hypothetical protein ACRERC_13895 [Candidatus Binatia bacterium]